MDRQRYFAVSAEVPLRACASLRDGVLVTDHDVVKAAPGSAALLYSFGDVGIGVLLMPEDFLVRLCDPAQKFLHRFGSVHFQRQRQSRDEHTFRFLLRYAAPAQDQHSGGRGRIFSVDIHQIDMDGSFEKDRIAQPVLFTE